MDGDFIIAAHAHRQLAQLDWRRATGSQVVGQLAQPGKIVAGPVRTSFQCGHSHQAEDIDIGQLRDRFQERMKLILSKTMLGRITRDVYFQQHIDRQLGRAGLAADFLQQPEAIDRVDQRPEGERPLDFVPLQMADQVPMDGQVGQCLGLGPQFLRPAFAQVGQAGCGQQAGEAGINIFGRTDELHRALRPPAFGRRRNDSLADMGQIILQAAELCFFGGHVPYDTCRRPCRQKRPQSGILLALAASGPISTQEPSHVVSPNATPYRQFAARRARGAGVAQEPKPVDPAAPPQNPPANPADEPAGLVKISKTNDVWLDTKRKAVVIDGEVCLREGQLEMFACPKGTKEHESVVSLKCLPEEVHAGLLAAGAKPGKPVKFDPQYKPATGDVVDIFVLWRDDKGEKHTDRAQDWIKHVKSDKPMEYDWVFAGSGFWKDEETGKEHYQANGGDFICVSNFPTATLDLPVESSQANADLMFMAFTEKIPPKGTKVRLVLVPRKKAAEPKPAETSPVEQPK